MGLFSWFLGNTKPAQTVLISTVMASARFEVLKRVPPEARPAAEQLLNDFEAAFQRKLRGQ